MDCTPRFSPIRLADLIESGVIDNSTKKMYRGKSLATCCIGTRRLYDYVNDNSLVEFYPTDVVLHPSFIVSNDKMIAINMAIQVDLRGQIRQGGPTPTAFFGSGGDHDFMRGANLSKDGRSIVCLLSTSDKTGRSNIVPSFGARAAVMMNRGDTNYLITEYGIAYLGGKSVRERAMALIEVAHPDHREGLLKKAREMGYIYTSQIHYNMASPELTARVTTDLIFKDGLKAHVRPIKPTDESMIRDLFYNLSDGSVYFRYFTPRKSMPHKNVREYVNINDEDGLSVVITTGPWEDCRIIAEARYLLDRKKEFADVSFVIDEDFQRRGLATFLLNYMMEIAAERGIKGFEADVLLSNTAMLKVFDKVPYVQRQKLSEGVVSLKFRFDELKETTDRTWDFVSFVGQAFQPAIPEARTMAGWKSLPSRRQMDPLPSPLMHSFRPESIRRPFFFRGIPDRNHAQRNHMARNTQQVSERLNPFLHRIDSYPAGA